MIKTLGCILIIAGCTLFGFVYSDKFTQRVIQLNEIERSIIQLKNEIVYVYTPLPDALYNISQKCMNPINQLYNDVSNFLNSNNIESVFEAFKMSIENSRDKLYLNNSDIKVILDLAKNLGESDVKGQNNIFELALTNLKKNINIAEQIQSKNLKIYRYLGFTFGIVIVILLV